MSIDTWKNMKVNKHFWAFFYYLKRRGFKVFVIKHKDGTADLMVQDHDY